MGCRALSVSRSCALFVSACLLIVAETKRSVAVTSQWLGSSGSAFETVSNWDNGVPAVGDVAEFSDVGTGPRVFFGVNAASDSLEVLAGSFQFESVSFSNPPIYDITTGVASVQIEQSSLTIGGTIGTIDMNVGNTIDVASNATLSVTRGAVTTNNVTVNDSSQLSVQGGSFTSNGSFQLDATSNLTLNGGAVNANAGIDNSAGGAIGIITGALSLNGGVSTLSAPSTGFTISGSSPAGTLRITTNASATVGSSGALGSLGTGTYGILELEGGGQLSSSSGSIGISSFNSFGSAHISGTDGTGTPSRWTSAGVLDIRSQATPGLLINNGGEVSNSEGRIGSTAYSGSAIVTGAGSKWLNSTNLLVGSGIATGSLAVRDQALVTVDGTLEVRANGTVTLDGGSVVTQTLDTSLGGTFDFLSGSLTINDGLEIGSGMLFPTNAMLGTDRQLGTAGTTTIAPFRTLTIDGGKLSTGGLNIQGTLDFKRGTLQINGGLTVGASGPFGNTLTVHAGQDLNVRDSLTVDSGAQLTMSGGVTGGEFGAIINNGFITGSGTLRGTLANFAGGEVEAFAGQNLVITGPSNQNVGQFTLSGGQLHFVDNLNNSAAGLIIGNGTLRVDNDLANFGVMAFSATANIIGDVTNNATGTIISAGGTTTFFDDVVNNGTIRTNENSFTVYFGSYSGNGDDGTGTVIMEGDLKPGSSPGTMSFGGDLSFGPDATLEIEIGGLLAGSEYDRIEVADFASLGGTLDVNLIDGFEPEIGDNFGFLFASGGFGGTFHTLDLPDIGPEKEWLLNPGGSTVFLEVRAVFSADFDLDGDVDNDDLLKWQSDYGVNGNSDADGDGDSDGADLLAWQQQNGSGVVPSAASQTVPEPTSVVMLLSIFWAFSCIRTHQQA